VKQHGQRSVELKREQGLIRAAQNGSEQALGEIYDAYVDKIYRYLLYRVDCAETAQDLTAEVFLRVVEGLGGYQDRDVPVLAWLYRIAYARLIDYYRDTNRIGKQQSIETIDVSQDDDLDGVLMSAYHQETVREALRLLTAEQQQVVQLRFMEGYSLQQTADALGKTIGAVKVLQHRALEALSRVLNKRGVVYEQE
jgi:RNA polymerase sigma-70 factor, ECF subfamily